MRKHLSLAVEFGFGRGEISESEKRSLTTMARNISRASSNQGAANATNAASNLECGGNDAALDQQDQTGRKVEKRANQKPRRRRRTPKLFPLRKIPFARANVQLRLCRRAHVDSPKARAARFVIGIVLKQILRSNLRRDPLKDPAQLAFISGNECSATGSCRDELHSCFRSSGAHIQVHRLAAWID